jgi:hypothetical protein
MEESLQDVPNNAELGSVKPELQLVLSLSRAVGFAQHGSQS